MVISAGVIGSLHIVVKKPIIVHKLHNFSNLGDNRSLILLLILAIIIIWTVKFITIVYAINALLNAIHLLFYQLKQRQQ